MTSTLISAEGPRDAPGGELISGPDVKELRPHKGWQLIDLRELWRYRDLLWFLALRDIQGRYKQSVLGIAWAVAQTMAMMVGVDVIPTEFSP